MAVPVAETLPNCPLAGGPPIWIASVPPVVCDKFPLTVSMLDGASASVPLLEKPPVVVNDLPFVNVRVPALAVTPSNAGNAAVLPESVTLALLRVMAHLPAGKPSVPAAPDKSTSQP